MAVSVLEIGMLFSYFGGRLFTVQSLASLDEVTSFPNFSKETGQDVSRNSPDSLLVPRRLSSHLPVLHRSRPHHQPARQR